jgi:hypothetical protein
MTEAQRAESMEHVVECLPSKHKALSSNPRTAKQKIKIKRRRKKEEREERKRERERKGEKITDLAHSPSWSMNISQLDWLYGEPRVRFSLVLQYKNHLQ